MVNLTFSRTYTNTNFLSLIDEGLKLIERIFFVQSATRKLPQGKKDL